MLHPFQTDPGTSQRQRLVNELLSGPAQIDNRSLADLLVFFGQLSRHVNYYDENLQVSDWQSFFQKSLPFTLASISRFDRITTDKKVAGYKKRFDRKPSPSGLYLLLRYTYTHIIKSIDKWQLQLAGTGLPVETVMDKLIRDKLSGPVKEFISYANAASHWFCTPGFRFSQLLNNPVWMLEAGDLSKEDDSFRKEGTSKRKRLIALYNKASRLVQTFQDVIRLLSLSAEQCIEQSLLPLKDELKEKHPPHLAILFAFLKLFRYLQNDLNTQTKKHLDFFYKQVLKLNPKEATPDKLHLVLDIQKQLDKYLFKKGLLFKDGKDNNKAEVYFAADDEIVVNKTQVADQRTLFLNNKVASSISFVEGVYMAPDATKSNGIDKDFTGDALPSRATLGAKWSKYADPENKFIYPYPNARLGFILASPVLLLNEGNREITITLSCEVNDNYCSTLVPQPPAKNPCCDPVIVGNSQLPNNNNNATNCLPPSPSSDLVAAVRSALATSYYYINQALIAKAVKKGISKQLAAKLQQLLVIRHIREESFRQFETDIIDPNLCYCTFDEKVFEITLPAEPDATHIKGFENIFSVQERELLKEFFKPRKALNVLFSGEKEWIAAKPDETQKNEFLDIVLGAAVGNQFPITITAKLTPDQPAVTFYNAETLKEDFNTTLPLVKIELDDKIKLDISLNASSAGVTEQCCERPTKPGVKTLSLYHFFRDIKLLGTTNIGVKVCNVKNLIVQNDENVENVNSPIRVFGSRPKTGASFYIGSKEIFSKNWQSIWVNGEWKDRPLNFETHYEQYAYTGFKFEDNSPKILEGSFKVTASVLDKGQWRKNGQRRLFKKRNDEAPPGPPPDNRSPFCMHAAAFEFNEDVYNYARGAFAGLSNFQRLNDYSLPLEPLNVSSQYGFLRLMLEGVGFQHDSYAFVLTRQMMALADMVSPTIIDPVIEKAKEIQKLISAIITRTNTIIGEVQSMQARLGVMAGNLNTAVGNLQSLVTQLGALLTNAKNAANLAAAVAEVVLAIGVEASIVTKVGLLIADHSFISGKADIIFKALTDDIGGNIDINNLNPIGLKRLATELETRINFIVDTLKIDPSLKIGIPNEPYTPLLKSLSIDYTASADSADIDIIHLYPYTATYKPEVLKLEPTMFPTFCDEGNFFIGLKDLVPGSNVNILFQLAEATADSESVRENVQWYYLENNTWKMLRTGFEVLNDDTDGLTTSGIIKFSLPANITNENSILPKGLHWIRASIPCTSRSVSEIIGIHTQAVRATFTNEAVNDKLRLAKPLEAGAVSKLQVADASVKKITQPYESFGGRIPEEEGHFYIRVSELLRHKNRAIQKFDYERLVLEAFPQIFKVKCINHSYALDAGKFINDFPVAPGYVLIATIPDLNQLKAAQSFEPKVPVSLLEQIEKYLKKITSPFVRMRIMNPRYEKVNFCIRVKLQQGKDEVYYKEEMKKDVREFLAPWAIGEYEKLAFGQPISRSDLIRFIESKDYIDYIIDLRMIHEDTLKDIKTEAGNQPEIVPISPRSILIAGSIDVCIDQPGCETWCICGDPANENKEPCCDHPIIPVRVQPYTEIV